MSSPSRVLAALLVLLASAAAAEPRSPAGEATLEQLGRTSPGKPTAPIVIDYAFGAEPAVGQTLEVRIVVRTLAEGGPVTLDVHATEPQALLVLAQSTAESAPGGGETWTVAVLPLREAAGYLSVQAQATIGGAPATRNLMIPIRVAGAKPEVRSSRALSTGPAGERLVVMPAEETHRRAN
jgi:hypothetical protein